MYDEKKMEEIFETLHVMEIVINPLRRHLKLCQEQKIKYNEKIISAFQELMQGHLDSLMKDVKDSWNYEDKNV